MKPLIFALLLCLLFGSCKQEIDLYEGGSSIYFPYQGLDTFWIAWGAVNSSERTMDLSLQVQLFGKVTNYPRKFSIKVISDEADSLHAVAGVDYEPFPLEYEMPPLSDHAFIDITLLRTDTLIKQGRRFTVQLLSNEEFGFEYMNYKMLPDSTYVMTDDHMVIYMDETFPEPSWWFRVGVPAFGKWSPTKGILICDVAGIDREKFQSDLDGKNGNLTVNYIKFVGRKIHLWLLEHPTLDENGELMEMGEESKKLN